MLGWVALWMLTRPRVVVVPAETEVVEVEHEYGKAIGVGLFLGGVVACFFTGMPEPTDAWFDEYLGLRTYIIVGLSVIIWVVLEYLHNRPKVHRDTGYESGFHAPPPPVIPPTPKPYVIRVIKMTDKEE